MIEGAVWDFVVRPHVYRFWMAERSEARRAWTRAPRVGRTPTAEDVLRLFELARDDRGQLPLAVSEDNGSCFRAGTVAADRLHPDRFLRGSAVYDLDSEVTP